jgi:hypothetical protein
VCAQRFVYFSFCFSHALLGSGGQLEGESIVEATIDATPSIWYRKGHTLPMIKPSDSPVNSAAAIPVWKQVIHLMVEFQDIDILISTRPDPLRDGWVRHDEDGMFLDFLC